MPYSRCPTCGSLSHINVSQDVAAWYAELFPTVPVGALVPASCLYCFPELTVGDSVIVREVQTPISKATAGDQGVIEALHNSTDGTLYLVRFTPELVEPMIRAELRKPSS